jgi:hypothetical protein
MDFKQWAIDRPLGEPGTTGYMMAEAAWAAASAAERERCIGLCHLKLNEAYTRILHSEGWSNTEVFAFTTAAESIAAAILDA